MGGSRSIETRAEPAAQQVTNERLSAGVLWERHTDV